jgi:hypothetical protein
MHFFKNTKLCPGTCEFLVTPLASSASRNTIKFINSKGETIETDFKMFSQIQMDKLMPVSNY